MTTPSIARSAFAEARSRVAAWGLDHPERSILLRAPARPQPSLPFGSADDEGGPLLRATREILAGRISATELVHAALRAVEAHAGLGGMAFVAAEAALATAASLDREARAGHIRGPLHGIPVTVKDVIHVAGMPTRAGSAAYESFPDRDAAAVARLRAAGAVVIGKATTHEFALGVTTPQARNPHDPTRIPGGSSGGSAIAVATGMGLASLGTDTRASIRNPGALSGVVGFKATLGAVPTEGVLPLSWTMDHVAPMASTVADAAAVLDVLMDRSPGLSAYAGAPVAGLRIGVPESAFAGCHPEVTRAVQKAIAALEGLGARVVPVSRPSADDLQIANAAGLLVSRCEAATLHRWLGTDLQRCWAEIRDQLDEAGRIPAHEYIAALRCRSQLADELLAAFAGVDALAMPTSLVPAPKVEEADQYLMVLSRNCIPWSFVGFPALSVPCRDRADGLPVGLQLVAPPHGEPVLVALGTAYERS